MIPSHITSRLRMVVMVKVSTEKNSGYLYWNGKRLEADDYRIYEIGSDYYLVNSKGKLQKSTSKYDVENDNTEDNIYIYRI